MRTDAVRSVPFQYRKLEKQRQNLQSEIITACEKSFAIISALLFSFMSIYLYDNGPKGL